MKSFGEIRSIAVERKGEEELALHMPEAPETSLIELSDDRVLAEFTKRIFQAGFNWKVIENKWPGFEAAFHGFDIGRNALMDDDEIAELTRNTDIVRNGPKIATVRENAAFLAELAREHGSAAAYLGGWPVEDMVGLFDLLKKRGARLGGMTGQYALRFMGYDNFILSKSVVAALNAHGVIDGAATSKKALAAAQEAFNAWHAESGEPYAVISRVLAFSVPD